MPKFIGRKTELHDLTITAQRPGAKFVVIKGRRRVGKSTLTKQFAKTQKHLRHYYLTGIPPSQTAGAQAELDNFSHQMKTVFKLKHLDATDWDTLLDRLGDCVAPGKCILIIDEINWVARSDVQFNNRLWRLWETRLSQLEDFVLILSGSLAGWIENKFTRNTGYLGRISWNMTLDEMPIHDALQFFVTNNKRISTYERLRILMVTGGIPRYLEEILPALTAEDNIKRLCFNPAGLLFNEYDQLLNDLFQRSNEIYRKIIEALADTPLTMQALQDKIDRSKSGVISRYINDLCASGFLAKQYTWNIKTGKVSNRYKIRIIDNYIRFYLKAIKPNLNSILAGNHNLPKNYFSILGFQFENVILKNKQLLMRALNVTQEHIVAEGPYYQNSTTKHPGCQIDYLLQTTHTLYVVEIKFRREEIPKSIIKEVEQKINALIIPRHKSVRPVLVHVNGVSEAVEQAEYFDTIIDFPALLEA